MSKPTFAFASCLKISKNPCEVLPGDFRAAIQSHLDSLSDDQLEGACIELEEPETSAVKRCTRGFPYFEFRDRYQTPCSMKKSSLATQDAIWLGVDDAEPRIMASQASEYGVETTETTGWIDYPIPKGVLINTSMHLTREDVLKLLPQLIHFANTGELKAK